MILLTENGRTFSAFWIFGLLNNVLYVVILSAAVDLVGPLVPKATVLLADVVPSFLIKLSAPFFIHLVPYKFRLGALVFLSTGGMLIIALSGAMYLRLFGIIMASLSSGLGELTFLQLTHYYGSHSLNGFSSGTGGAGLVGSFLFMMLTTWMKLSASAALILFSIAPFGFIATFASLLPRADKSLYTPDGSYAELPSEADSTTPETLALSARDINAERPTWDAVKAHIVNTSNRVKRLFFPYMLPLMTVYMAEYTINQGVAPTLLFPLEEMPFHKFRDAYVTYGTLYQLGVFISRSSAPFVRINNLYLLSILQGLNLAACIWQSISMFIPNIYWMFLLIFYEGLLGGASYVNTFMKVTEKEPLTEREFAMGAVGISDSGGIVVAGAVCMWLEKRLCAYQKSTGRPWCELA